MLKPYRKDQKRIKIESCPQNIFFEDADLASSKKCFVNAAKISIHMQKFEHQYHDHYCTDCNKINTSMISSIYSHYRYPIIQNDI